MNEKLKLIAESVKYIEDLNNPSIKAYSKTIKYLLNGNNYCSASPIFLKNTRLFGALPIINKKELLNLLNECVSQGLLSIIRNNSSNNHPLFHFNKEYNETGFILDDILQGRETAIKYDKKHLEGMCDWNAKQASDGKIPVKLDDGFEFRCDSKNEHEFYEKLTADNYYKVLRAQKMFIPFKAKRKHKNAKKYYPDFVLLNKNDYICIIEIKPLYNMICATIQKKYKGLRRFCEKNGYLYVMCDENFNTIDELNKIDISKELNELFVNEFKKVKSRYNIRNAIEGNLYKTAHNAGLVKNDENFKLYLASYLYQKRLKIHGNGSFDYGYKSLFFYNK